MTEFDDYAKAISAPTLKEIYKVLLEVLDTYMVMKPEDLKTVAMWIMATADKDSLLTIPILYMNASKGSGKSRLLKLIVSLIPNAKLTQNLSESALFRLPGEQHINALGIDEAERITSKDKGNLRELLNSCYKRGAKVLRTIKTKEGTFRVEEFDVFMGVCLANIYGLENVLEDRAVTIILEKSKDKRRTKIPEFFDLDKRIKLINQGLEANSKIMVQDSSVGSAGMQEVSLKKDMMERLFYHILMQSDIKENKQEPSTSYTTYTTHTTYTTNTTYTSYTNNTTDTNNFINKVLGSDLDGRSLEIWLPLLVTAYFVSDEVFTEFIQIAQTKSKEKEITQVSDDRDVLFISFINEFIKGKDTDDFTTYNILKKAFEEQEEKPDWLSNEWIGRCLKRTVVCKTIRRLSRGMEVIIDPDKVKKYLETRGIYDTLPSETEGNPKPSSPQGSIEAICESCGKKKLCTKVGGRLICEDCNTKEFQNTLEDLNKGN